MTTRQLWAEPTPVTNIAAPAMACAAHAITEASQIPGAEDDWDLRNAIAALNQALEHLQSWAERSQ